jgi:WD40 repeat protein
VKLLNRLAAIITLTASVTSSPSPLRAQSGTSERLLTDLQAPPGWRVGAVTVSRDGRRVAYVRVTGGSGSSSSGKSIVVVDDKAEKPYDAVRADSLVFSPDGQRVAYVARAGKKWLAIVNGTEEKSYDTLGQSDSRGLPLGVPLAFSADSRRWAYAALKGGVFSDQWVVVVNGTEEKKTYDYIGAGTPVFSPDGQHLAYVGKTGGKWHVIMDGTEQKREYGNIARDGLHFSPNGQRLAFNALIGSKPHLVLDGKEVGPYDGLSDTLLFSPDSRRFAYGAQVGAKWRMVVDGRDTKEYDSTGTPFFSPDNRHFAHFARMGNKVFYVVDGREDAPQDFAAEDGAFSPDSQRFAYVARSGSTWLVVVDGIARQHDGLISSGSLVFGPDSLRVGYVVGSTVGGGPGTKWRVAVDGWQGKEYDDVLPTLPGGQGRVVFTGTKNLRYVGRHGNSLYIVDETLE